MADYVVSIDNEENNLAADNLSVTGRVNRVNCAVLLRISKLVGLSKEAQKRIKQQALIQAYLKREAVVLSGPGEKVSL